MVMDESVDQGNLYRSSGTQIPPGESRRSVILGHVDTFSLPMKCVVCGSDRVEIVSYFQEHFPLVVPPLGIHRRRAVALPYCAFHAARFRRRFSILRFVQYAWIIAAFALLNLSWMLYDDDKLAAPGIAGMLLFAALPLTLVVRGYMYDAFFTNSKHGLRVTSRYPGFIEGLREAMHRGPKADTPAMKLPSMEQHITGHLPEGPT